MEPDLQTCKEYLCCQPQVLKSPADSCSPKVTFRTPPPPPPKKKKKKAKAFCIYEWAQFLLDFVPTVFTEITYSNCSLTTRLGIFFPPFSALFEYESRVTSSPDSRSSDFKNDSNDSRLSKVRAVGNCTRKHEELLCWFLQGNSSFYFFFSLHQIHCFSSKIFQIFKNL